MLWQQTQEGMVLRGAIYTVRLQTDGIPRLTFVFDGKTLSTFPVASAVDAADKKELLRQIRILQLDAAEDRAYLLAEAESDCWLSHTFEWVFKKEEVVFSQAITGHGTLGRCYFLSGGRAGKYDRGDSNGIDTYAQIHLPYYRPMTENLTGVTEYDVSHPGYIGIACSDQPDLRDCPPAVFTPGPFTYAFYEGETVMGVGIATKPGAYRFNGFEYTGSSFSGASFYVNYLGYTAVAGTFHPPVVSLHFDWSTYGVLHRHMSFIDREGYGTTRCYPSADWHYMPIFCGWAEQTSQAEQYKVSGNSMATQANYEAWIRIAEERGLPLGTIIIDDKWQKEYGTFAVDENKWPDMKGFVEAQHAKGRHVLLWVPGYYMEGVQESWCVRDEQGNCVFADPANPAYEAFLRRQIRHLVADLGIDGFKEDWVASSAKGRGYTGYGTLHGLELFRRFQWILYDEAHVNKPDALIETQTPHPLFRESSDMLRLNDIWFGNRRVCNMMQGRARVASIAGWTMLDCDNASSTTVAQWFAYAQLQTELGIPALYFLHETESAHETVPDAQWNYLSELWKQYVRKNRQSDVI